MSLCLSYKFSSFMGTSLLSDVGGINQSYNPANHRIRKEGFKRHKSWSFLLLLVDVLRGDT